MKIKSFVAGTSKEAMEEVKAEFGESALILKTKKLDSNKGVEIVAAVEYDDAVGSSGLILPGGVGGRNTNLMFSPAYTPHSEPAAKGEEDHGDEIPGEVPEKRVGERRKDNKKLQKELLEVKGLLARMLTESKRPFGETFLKLEADLVSAGIDRHIIDKVLLHTFKNTSPGEAEDLEFLKSYIKSKIMSKVKTFDPLKRAKAVAFVGPAGAGKTSTLAKVACKYGSKGGRSMAMLTMDSYRFGARAELGVYGDILGFPVGGADSIDEVKSFLEAHSDKDCILIDTPGRGSSDEASSRQLEELAGLDLDLSFNLVVNSQTKDDSLYGVVQSYGSLPIDSLTFTRLDEGTSFGSIVNTSLYSKKPVAYLSTGQSVSKGLEVATQDKIMEFVNLN